MSNEGGISRSEVNSIVNNRIAPVERQMKGLQQDLSSSINQIHSKISNVKSELLGTINNAKREIYDNINAFKREVNSEIRRLEGDIMALSNNLEKLINNLNSRIISFEEAFRSGQNNIVGKIEKVYHNVAKLEEESKKNTKQVVEKLDETGRATSDGLKDISGNVQSVAKETRNGTEEVSRQVSIGAASTSDGLQKVSSGVALREFLEGQFMVSESDLAIRNVREQIESRYDQAQKNVEKIQSLYDDHFQRAINGFVGDLNIISSHIRQLEEKAFKNLSQISFDFHQDRDRFERVVFAEQKRIEQRSQVIQAEYEKLDLKELARFKELYHEMVHFIQDQKLLQIEFEKEENSQGLTGNGYFLPIILVQMEENHETDVYCLGANSPDCSQPVEIPPDMKMYANQLRTFSDELKPHAGSYISQDEQNELCRAMESLRDKGLIGEIDYEMIEEHMNTHKLTRLCLENAD